MDPELIKKIRNLPVVVSLGDMSWNKTGSWSLQKPVFSTKYPPCQEGCPAHVPVREIMAKIKTKDIDGAAKLFVESNPFPAITGRVCHHPCQLNCLRGKFDGALEIRAVERLLGDFVTTPIGITGSKPETTGEIAVAGSGPSGLACAYFLRLNGYNVTIFESRSQPGGLLRFGIPPYRLSDDVLDKEIKRLEKMGIEFKTGVTVTGKLIKEELSRYNAVFLGIGAHVSRNLRIPGEDLDQVLSGLTFLFNYENYRAKFKNKKVVVIGGGNTAMDAARTALRLGARANILYRRTRQEMPAIHEEIEGALEEGCKIDFLSAPVEIKQSNGQLELYCVRMRLGEPDESGRRRPEPIHDSQFKSTYDYVISAVGEDPDFRDFDNLFLVEHNAIKINETGQTGVPSIFAGGDAAGYPRTVVDAIASGKKAATAIHYFLRGKQQPQKTENKSPLTIDDVNTSYFVPEEAVHINSLTPEDREGNFSEIISSLTEQEAVEESERCFSCGACTFCDNCVIFCPDFSVIPSENKYRINEEYCKGCGICIKECPRGVIHWSK